MRESGLERTALILVGPALGSGDFGESALYSAGYDRRFRARPGLTGYAAVCGFRGEVRELQAIIDRVDADNEYIDTWSFGLDVKIIWRTLPLIFGDVRAY